MIKYYTIHTINGSHEGHHVYSSSPANASAANISSNIVSFSEFQVLGVSGICVIIPCSIQADFVSGCVYLCLCVSSVVQVNMFATI